MPKKIDLNELFERELAALDDRMTNCAMLIEHFRKRRDEVDDPSERADMDGRARIIETEIAKIGPHLERIKAAVAAPVSGARN